MKRTISILVIAVLLLSLSACSFQKVSTAEPEPTATAAVAAPTTAPVIVTAAPVIVEEPKEPEAPAEFLAVKASDLYTGYGYAKKEVENTAVYDCVSTNSEDGLWKVYVLDEEFTDAERYIPQSYRVALSADGSVEACKGQWIYVYCNSNEWTGETAPEGAAFTVKVNEEKNASGVQTSYKTSSTTGATAGIGAATGASAAPSVSTGNSEGVTITITKDPSEETIKAGTVTQFIAHADGAVSVLWYAIDPEGVYHTMEETREMFPNMALQYQNGGDVLCVKWPDTDFNGWQFVARYQNGSVFKETAPAYLWVIE